MYDLRESGGRNKRDAGELTPVRCPQQNRGARAKWDRETDLWWWEYEEPVS